MHQKHAGHAEMHAEMVLILLVVLVVSQILLVQWRKRRPASYHLCTLVGMWVIPVGLSLRNHWWRFPCVWLGFSAITGLVTRKCTEKPIQAGRSQASRPLMLLLPGHHAQDGLQMVSPHLQD
jgi:RING finger protein 121